MKKISKLVTNTFGIIQIIIGSLGILTFIICFIVFVAFFFVEDPRGEGKGWSIGFMALCFPLSLNILLGIGMLKRNSIAWFFSFIEVAVLWLFTLQTTIQFIHYYEEYLPGILFFSGVLLLLLIAKPEFKK